MLEVLEHLILEVLGGGGINRNGGTLTPAPSGEENGGAGGAALGYREVSSWYSRRAGGGAGNPGGKGAENGLGNSSNGTGENGTGGLLIVYANIFENYGKIESNGSKGGKSSGESAGGSSGGGSINIFYNKCIKDGLVEAIGGESSGYVGGANGGKGGDGTTSIGNVSTGNYVED